MNLMMRQFQAGLGLIHFLAIPLVVFLYKIPVELLNVKNTAFITNGTESTLDAAQSVTGLNSFLAQSWTFPPGTLNNLGSEANNSVLFSNSTPWFSFLAKGVNSAYTFHNGIMQFIGIELLIGCILLYVITYKYFRWESVSITGSSLGAILIMLLPSHQIHWIWPSLSYKFIIIAAIWTARTTSILNLRKANLICFSLGVLSATTHSYFFPMVFLILFFSLLYEFKSHIKRNTSLAVSNIGGFVIGNYVSGGFNAGLKGASAGTQDVGPYAADLLTYFNSYGTSSILKRLPAQPSMEGFSYPGIAIYFIFAIALIFLARNRKPINKFVGSKKNKLVKSTDARNPVNLNTKTPFKYVNYGGFFLFALSVGPAVPILGQYHWITQNTYALSAFSVFRASGRFSWVFVFTLTCSAIILLSKNVQRNVFSLLLIACLFFHFFEFDSFSQSYKKTILTAIESKIPSKSNEIDINTNKPIVFVPAFPAPDTTPWRTYLIDFAAAGGEVKNFAYMSRIPTRYVVSSVEETEQRFTSNSFEPQTYLMIRNDYYSKFKMQRHVIFEFDNWTLVEVK
jgi:hypothetical protein